MRQSETLALLCREGRETIPGVMVEPHCVKGGDTIGLSSDGKLLGIFDPDSYPPGMSSDGKLSGIFGPHVPKFKTILAQGFAEAATTK